MNIDQLERFQDLRNDLFDVIRQLLARDGHCKHYEGTFRIQFPSYFATRPDVDDPQPWAVFLDCYVIGPHRHYEWWGETFAEALNAAEADIRAWMHEALEDE
jgi:hypothetical protein